MSLHFPKAKIVFPGHALNNQIKDLWLHDGKIYFSPDQLQEPTEIVENAMVSPGWVDMQARAYEPGAEVKETVASLARAARHGGFTTIAVLPCTNPVIDGREGVAFLKHQGERNHIRLLPIGAATQGAKGEKLAEMLDQNAAGAVAFGDDKPISNPDLVLKSLQYLQHINGLLIQRPFEHKLAAFGQMNDGIPALLLGLEGIPELAESMMVNRDLQLLEHVGGRLHFSLVSCPESVSLVNAFKARGFEVTCSMAGHQLSFTDEALENFDTNLKVSPPFRSATTNEFLKKALTDGLIDVVVSDHNPLTIDSKLCEFDQAENGISSIETTFFSLLETLGAEHISKIIELISINPRKVLKLPLPSFENGSEADLTFFSTSGHTNIDRNFFRSQSANSPFMGKALPGQIFGTCIARNWQANNQQPTT